ncbi:PLP-dependent aminotransferase family protein [Mesorhizobium sp. M0074]
MERRPCPSRWACPRKTPFRSSCGRASSRERRGGRRWSRVFARAARRAAAAPVSYPDPRGDPQLRKEIAAYVGIARGLRCSPAQVFITAGYAGAIGLAVRALQVEGSRALIEDPSFPITRKALDLAGITVTAVPVDAEGLDVASGIRSAQNAALAIVTPRQHAPLGMTMSLTPQACAARLGSAEGRLVIEDDYLSELQLTGRAAPALASLDHGGRVLHIGNFSKTISPVLRLGFVVAPIELTGRFGDVCACLAPAPALALQGAVAEFLREGHYIRHLRRMKRLYASRRQALVDGLAQVGSESLKVEATAGLAVIVSITASLSDVQIARRARSFGLAPSPLSQWCVRSPPWQGAPARRDQLGCAYAHTVIADSSQKRCNSATCAQRSLKGPILQWTAPALSLGNRAVSASHTIAVIPPDQSEGPFKGQLQTLVPPG